MLLCVCLFACVLLCVCLCVCVRVCVFRSLCAACACACGACGLVRARFYNHGAFIIFLLFPSMYLNPLLGRGAHRLPGPSARRTSSRRTACVLAYIYWQFGGMIFICLFSNFKFKKKVSLFKINF